MRVCVVGVNHSTTPLSIRERLAVSANHLADTLSAFHELVGSGVLISTCNRTEAYSIDDGTGSVQRATIDFLSRRAQIPDRELRPYLYSLEEREAVKHLFCVASGLDSMIVGEYEILGQVRQALEQAEKTGQVDTPLLNLFRHALRVGRRVRQETGISRHALSVSSVAVELATKVVGNLFNCQILVVGAGEAGRLVAKAARDRGASRIEVVSRTTERAAALAEALGGRALGLEHLGSALSQADVVVSCTGAPRTIITRQLIEQAMRSRQERPLVVVDIAVPRDVEPGVRQMENVFLFDIDDLTQISQLNRQRRQNEVQNAMKIVEEEGIKYAAWWQDLETKPVVSALVQKADTIRRAQLEMTLKKLGNLTDEERESLEAMSKAIMKKILHDPIQCLKQNGHNGVYNQAIRELFKLDSEVPECPEE